MAGRAARGGGGAPAGRVTSPVIYSVLLRETPGTYWFRCVLADGRTVNMAVPKADHDPAVTGEHPECGPSGIPA
jgi:hypothetical protein